jgi:hypothetical protein
MSVPTSTDDFGEDACLDRRSVSSELDIKCEEKDGDKVGAFELRLVGDENLQLFQ